MKYCVYLFLIAVALIAVVNGVSQGASLSEENLPRGRPKNCPLGTAYLNVCNTCMCGETSEEDFCTRMYCPEENEV